MENLDERSQRIQDRLRADGDEEAAELIDELYGLFFSANETLVAAASPEPVAVSGVGRTAVLKESPWWVDQDKLPAHWPRLPVQARPSS